MRTEVSQKRHTSSIEIVLGTVPPHRLSMSSRPVLWGWKRDRQQLSRIIYLHAQIVRSGNFLVLRDPFLFYRQRAPQYEIDRLRLQIEPSAASKLKAFSFASRVRRAGDCAVLTFTLGCPEPYDELLIRRLLRRRPHRIPPVQLITEYPYLDLLEFGPFDLYAGSGLSYEAGIPLLSSVHQAYGVDSLERGDFLLGLEDPIPGALACDPVPTLKKTVACDLACMAAKPSESHWRLKDLYREGWIGKVFTDNVDDLFEQIKLPHMKTRGHGLFNDRFEATFSRSARSLMVLGVSADRRGIISQARRNGLKILVINPCLPVSPRSRNLDYLRRGDIFIRRRAADVMPVIASYLMRNVRRMSLSRASPVVRRL